MRYLHLLIALGFALTVIMLACSSTPAPDSGSTHQETPAATQDAQDTVLPEPSADPEPMETPAETSPPVATSAGMPEPAGAIPRPEDASDAQLIEAATLFKADFESGLPGGLNDWAENWHIEQDGEGNAVFCNEVSDNWSSFQFGHDEWGDYAVSLRMKFLSADEDQLAETYIRINREVEGYRAGISDNQWASIGYCSPCSELDGAPISLNQDEWIQIELRFVEEKLEYFINGEMALEVIDERRMSGRAGFGAGPNTEVRVDDILVWALDANGNPTESSADLAIEPVDETVYTLREKIDNRPTVPVFYPWSGSGEGINCGQPLRFDFDIDDTPYSLIWTSSGTVKDIEAIQPEVSREQSAYTS